MHAAKTNVDHYLTEKRWNKRLTRRDRLAERIAHRNAQRDDFASRFGTHSKVAMLLAGMINKPNFKGHKRPEISVRFSFPEKFSLLDHPDAALNAIGVLAQKLTQPSIRSIFLDFSNLSETDLAANALLDILIDEIRVSHRLLRPKKTRWRGIYPKDPSHKRFMKAMGVVSVLQIESEKPSDDEAKKLKLFEQRCRNYDAGIKPLDADRKAHVISGFMTHLAQCLSTIGKTLDGELCQQVGVYMGEIIDNAEEHAGMIDWTIQGYLDTWAAAPMCEIVICNFGTSISKSLTNLPHGHNTLRQLRTYLTIHSAKKYFGPQWHPAELVTLCALQQGVSRKNDGKSTTRGQGTVDFIDAFQRIHEEYSPSHPQIPARMAILSGSSYVLFDGTYRMTGGESANRTIAFNKSNSLQEKPDQKYVRHLNGVDFPGTLISIRFPLVNGTHTADVSCMRSQS
jgi:hypothetical protein